MLTAARILFVLAVPAAICALAARFVQPEVLLMILPSTWLKITGLLLMGSVASSLLEIAEQLQKKA